MNLTNFFTTLFSLSISFFAPVIVIIGTSFFIVLIQYRKTEYYAATKKPIFKMLFDKGCYGEYLLYKNLEKLKGHKRFLFNCYIPKEDGKTTEIDVIMLHSSGIYVFESKNYSGWIFGTETQKNWTQSLPRGKSSQKIKFLNPIFQNQLHINALKSFLPPELLFKTYSIIVFSERCSLKKINLSSNSHTVLKRSELSATVTLIAQTESEIIAKEQIEQIYTLLFPLTQVTEEIKKQHIEMIISSDNKSMLDFAEVEVEEKSEEIEPQIDELKSSKNICDKCGSEMILRTASKGEQAGSQFLGCSKFPKCRNIINVNK